MSNKAALANERPSAKQKIADEFVLYADGFPVHSTHEVNDLHAHKVIAIVAAQKAGKAMPKFHVVLRDVNDKHAAKSIDTIIDGDEECPPAGCNLEHA